MTYQYNAAAIRLAESRGYDDARHRQALDIGDEDAIGLTHPAIWLTEDEVETPGFLVRFIARPEDAAECEWDTFLVGWVCDRHATSAVIDTGDHSDGFDGLGFHWAHGCNQHIEQMLTIANSDATLPDTREV